MRHHVVQPSENLKHWETYLMRPYKHLAWIKLHTIASNAGDFPAMGDCTWSPGTRMKHTFTIVLNNGQTMNYDCFWKMKINWTASFLGAHNTEGACQLYAHFGCLWIITWKPSIWLWFHSPKLQSTIHHPITWEVFLCPQLM